MEHEYMCMYFFVGNWCSVSVERQKKPKYALNLRWLSRHGLFAFFVPVRMWNVKQVLTKLFGYFNTKKELTFMVLG